MPGGVPVWSEMIAPTAEILQPQHRAKKEVISICYPRAGIVMKKAEDDR